MKKNDIEKEFLTEIDTEVRTRSRKRKQSINSKRKGNHFEYTVYKMLNEKWGEDLFQRSMGSGNVYGGGNRSKSNGVDQFVKEFFTGDVVPRKDFGFRFSIECKSYADTGIFWELFNDASNLHGFMSQAEGDAKSIGKTPMLITKYNNHKPIVYLKEKAPIKYFFEHNGWYCYDFEELLTVPNEFFILKK